MPLDSGHGGQIFLKGEVTKLVKRHSVTALNLMTGLNEQTRAQLDAFEEFVWGVFGVTADLGHAFPCLFE